MGRKINDCNDNNRSLTSLMKKKMNGNVIFIQMMPYACVILSQEYFEFNFVFTTLANHNVFFHS